MAKKKQTPEDPAVASSGSIERTHGLLSKSVRDLLGGVAIKPSTGTNKEWKLQQIGPVDFDMVSLGGTKVLSLVAPRMHRRCAAMKWWVTWRERWIAVGSDGFRFNSAQWTLSYGDRVADRIEFIRAEWQLPPSIRRPNEPVEIAGQPHWHIHRAFEQTHLEAEVFTVPDDGDVEEYSLVEAAQVQIARVHLAMAGWDHSQEHPGCWQKPVKADVCTMLQQWRDAVLVYMQSQLSYVVITS